ncbi:MAG TPA: hypothetical protein PKA37_15005, partial [Planctomycetota bacterium]|nr:hypothetical protein [Planctomycetota bacterium]
NTEHSAEDIARARVVLRAQVQTSGSRRRRLLALMAMKELPDPTEACTSLWLALANSEDALERRLALDALIEHKQHQRLGEAFEPLLIQRLSQHDPWLAFREAWPRLSIEQLRAILRAWGPYGEGVREHFSASSRACDSLLQLGPVEAASVAEKLRPWLSEAMTLLADVAAVATMHALPSAPSPVPAELFPQGLLTRRKRLRVQCLARHKLLVKLQTADALALLQLLEPYDQARAVEDLLKESPASLGPILEALRPGGLLREVAEQHHHLLSHVSPPPAVVIPLLTDPDPHLRAIAIHAAVKFGPPMPPELVQPLLLLLREESQRDDALFLLHRVGHLNARNIPEDLLAEVQLLIENPRHVRDATGLLHAWSERTALD